MGTKEASFDVYDAKTPSSIASSPRDVEDLTSDQTSTTLRRAAAQLASSTAPDSPCTPPTAYVLHDLWLAARHTRRDAEGLHGVLQIVQGHIHDLRQELVSVAAEMERQEQAHEIKMMEKQCEIRLLESESTAYSMAAMARVATVTSLQQSTDALLAEREVTKKALATVSSDLESKTIALQTAEAVAATSTQRNQELESLLEKLQTELSTAQNRIEELEKKETQHEATKLFLEAAQADASSAAGQLVDACEENAKLSDALGTLQMELEQRDVELAQIRQEKKELVAALQQRQGDSQVEQGNLLPSPGKTKSSASRRVQVAVRTHINHAFETPGSVHSTAPMNTNTNTATSGSRELIGNNSGGALIAAADPDDLLAMEISRLRMHTEQLEMQLAESKNAGPVLAALEKEAGALRRENATLRTEVDHAALEAAEAQRELHQVHSEARVLHGQLSEVISSLAGAGLATSPVGLLQSLAPPQQQLLTLPSSSVSDALERENEQPGKKEEEEKEVIEEAKTAAGTTSSGLHSAPSWRGPPTPTWEVAPAASSAATRSGGDVTSYRPASDSMSGGDTDLTLAELRTAMAQLDLVTSLGADKEEDTVKRTPPALPTTATPILSPLPPAAAPSFSTASEILESISRGIAALGSPNVYDGKQIQAISSATNTLSSSEGAATVTPRTDLKSNGTGDAE